jgi:hypothetical protein
MQGRKIEFLFLIHICSQQGQITVNKRQINMKEAQASLTHNIREKQFCQNSKGSQSCGLGFHSQMYFNKAP